MLNGSNRVGGNAADSSGSVSPIAAAERVIARLGWRPTRSPGYETANDLETEGEHAQRKRT